jgi:hypothetical protein
MASPTLLAQARKISNAAAYIEAVRRVLATAADECKTKGGRYAAFAKQYWRKRFVTTSIPDKKQRALVFEWCTLESALAQCPRDAPYEFHRRIHDIRDELWVRMDGLGVEQLKTLAATLTPTSFDTLLGRLEDAVEKDALELYRHHFVPVRVALQLDVVSAMSQPPKTQAETHLYNFAFKDSKACPYLMESDWFRATHSLDSGEKRDANMVYYHVAMASIRLERLLKERDQRRLAVAMALHKRLGSTSLLAGLSDCVMEALLLKC